MPENLLLHFCNFFPNHEGHEETRRKTNALDRTLLVTFVFFVVEVTTTAYGKNAKPQ